MINPVQGFKEASAPKKAAMVAGAAAAAAGVAATVYAVKHGEGDKFIKKMGNGYKAAGHAALDTVKKGYGKVKEKLVAAKDFIKSKFHKAKPEVEQAGREAANAVG